MFFNERCDAQGHRRIDWENWCYTPVKVTSLYMCGNVLIPVKIFVTGYTKANKLCRLWGVHKPGISYSVHNCTYLQKYSIKMQFALYRVFNAKMEFHQVNDGLPNNIIYYNIIVIFSIITEGPNEYYSQNHD